MQNMHGLTGFVHVKVNAEFIDSQSILAPERLRHLLEATAAGIRRLMPQHRLDARDHALPVLGPQRLDFGSRRVHVKELKGHRILCQWGE